MPSWKKLIVSGSDASLNSLTVANNVAAATYSGAWNGSVIGSSYLDADTMHLSVAQTVTANKTFNDNVKAIFGTGGDLEIFHDGSNSIVNDKGPGVMELRTNGTEIQLTGASGVDYMARFISDGAVNLYFNNSLKLETTAGGVTISGSLAATGDILPTVDNTGVIGNTNYTWANGQFTNLTVDSTLTVTSTLNVRAAIDLADSDTLRFGTSDDFKMYYDGTANEMEFEMEATCNQIRIHDNGTTRFTLGRATGDFYATGDITGSNALINGVVRATGDVVAYYSSDRGLKDNIYPIENALEKVEALGGYEFDWNGNQDVYTGHDIGVIAQEVEAVLPELVQTRDNGYKAVKYEKLTAVLIQAVKELSARLKELENK